MHARLFAWLRNFMRITDSRYNTEELPKLGYPSLDK